MIIREDLSFRAFKDLVDVDLSEVIIDFYGGMSTNHNAADLFLCNLDNYKVFEPTRIWPYVKKLYDSYVQSAYMSLKANNSFKNYPTYISVSVPDFKYMRLTSNILYVQMLKIINGKESCSYNDVWQELLKPQGKPKGCDVESFKGLIKNKLIAIHHHQRATYYEITPFGKTILKIVEINDKINKVLQYSKSKDINLEDYPITPGQILDIVKSIFDTNSDIQAIGSHGYWLNKLIEFLKNNEQFYNMFFNCDAIKAYIDSHPNKLQMDAFKKVLAKITKKHSKKKTN
jgi:hypothetical protein